MRSSEFLGRLRIRLPRFWESSDEPHGRRFSRLNSVDFVDSLRGWIVGDGSVVLATTDGGLSWTMQDPGVVCNLRCVRFVDRQRGWIVGGGAHILATSDGGNTWETQFCLGKGILKSVHFLDSKFGWAVGNVVLYTRDAGATWHECDVTPTLNVSRASRFLRGVQFVNRDVGWIVGHTQKWPPSDRKETDVTSLILATTDGGESWFQPAQIDGGMLKSVHFTDQKIGWVAGNTLWSTLDGGQSWQIQSSERMRPINSVFFQNNQRGWGAGQAVVYRTTNGGLKWEAARVSPQTQLMDAHFVNADHGWAVGIRSEYSSRLTCGIHISTDGGIHWRDVELVPDETTLSKLVAYYGDFTRLEAKS